MNRTQPKTPLIALIALAVLFAIGWGSAPKAVAESAGDATDAVDTSTYEFQNVEELFGKSLGMISGGAFDTILFSNYDGFEQKDFSYYNSYAEIIQALKTNKIDAMITDLPVAQLAVSRNTGIGILPEKLVEDHYGYVLAKNSPYTAMFNERLAAYREDGTIEELYKKWTSTDDTNKTLPEQDWDTSKGTLSVAVGADSEPMAYQIGETPSGMTVDLLCHIFRDLGYGMETKSLASGSLIAEVQSGKADVATSCFSITEERKKMVDMTEPFYDGGIVAVVRDTAAVAEEEQGFFEGLAASFERTFITEGRWQLILSGLIVTLLISVISGAAGLALGFLFVLLRRKRESGLADKLIHLLESLLGGLPVVVVLMVFYYVVFGSLTISGVVVAILVFTLIFGASAGSIMWNAVRAIDAGQVEAGRALGFGDSDTFFLVVLPQAARQCVPLLIAQFVSLIKDTSVVGYIAVQDLTRVGDLIRARTMEAFFPLIAIAVIYFVLCRLMAWLLSLWAKKLEPKEEPRTIKGVVL